MNNELDNFFYPKSIAIIGASSKRTSLSWQLINNMLNFGYEGKIYPVNPKADAVHSIRAYKSMKEIDDILDLVIIMVPRDLVLSAIDDCGKKKVRSVVVITAGFKEVGVDGIALEKQLMDKIKKYRMRLVGPNCMGLINTNPKIRLNGTFVLGTPIHGGIGFVSQSGALGAAVLKTVQQNDVGLAQFISIGNKADVSGNTVLEYWKDNPDIKVITIYLESFNDPRCFMKITRDITKTKPVIVIKAARTSAGMKAASSHTGALAGTDTIFNAIFEQGGVIRAATTDEMFDLAKAFDGAKLPKGNRLGILTNAGGPAILTVDEAEKAGLVIPEISETTVSKLKEFAPPEASYHNPVDLLPSATAEMYGEATKLMLADSNIDSLIVILGPPLMYDTVDIASHICKAAEDTEKTMTLVLMSQDELIPRFQKTAPKHPPVFKFPESAAMAIGKMYEFSQRQKLPKGEIRKFESEKKTVSKIFRSLNQTGEFYLENEYVNRILKSYYLPVIESYTAKNVELSLEIANKIRYPVVVKAVGKDLIHKTEVGGVITDIRNDEELKSAENKIISSLRLKGIESKLEGFLIQPYLHSGIETIMGIFKDPKAGHLIMFGIGGIMVEVLRDVKFRLMPINNIEAKELVRSIQSYKLLTGIRGKPAVDIDYIEENLLRLSQLITDFPQITEVDFNPFIFSNRREECKILDARIKVTI
jgi:acetyl coenzyme A synthetase (ADP forming)-like protein